MSCRTAIRRIFRYATTPALLAGVVVLCSLVSCEKNIDNSLVQMQKDRAKLSDFLNTHCRTPSGDILPLSQVPGATGESLPEGYVPLCDTAAATGNMYVIHLAEGAGDRAAGSLRVSIRYQGYYLDGLQLFDAVWDDQPPYPLWVSGALSGIRAGLATMRSGVLDPQSETGYRSPGQAWFILPSPMAYGQDGRNDPPVPPNTCVAYRIILYGILDTAGN